MERVLGENCDVSYGPVQVRGRGAWSAGKRVVGTENGDPGLRDRAWVQFGHVEFEDHTARRCPAGAELKVVSLQLTEEAPAAIL